MTSTFLHGVLIIYGLAVALLAIAVWEKYTEVMKTVSAEATEIAALYRDAGAYPEPTRSKLRAEIKAYTEFMGGWYGEEYTERDILQVTDRICLNNRESLDVGDERTFAIVWRDGRVFKRVVKGGPINSPRQERALLLCPGDFVVRVLTGGVTDGVRAGVRAAVP